MFNLLFFCKIILTTTTMDPKKEKELLKAIDSIHFELTIIREQLESRKRPSYYNFRETIRKCIEFLLIPTLVATIYYCLKN